MQETVRRYWPVIVVIAVGAVLLLVLNFTVGGEAMVWTGAILGVLVGIVVAAVAGRDQRATNQSASSRRASRKRRR